MPWCERSLQLWCLRQCIIVQHDLVLVRLRAQQPHLGCMASALCISTHVCYSTICAPVQRPEGLAMRLLLQFSVRLLKLLLLSALGSVLV